MSEDEPAPIRQVLAGGGSAVAHDHDVAQLVESAAAWIDEALKAWSENDYGKVAVLAPLAVEHLGKAVLWNENPVLVVPLTQDAEATLFGLATEPRLADPKLRTVGLATLLRRLDSLLGGLPIGKSQRTRMVEVRNGAMHVGTPAQSRHVLIDSLAVCNVMLEKLGRQSSHFYRDHHDSVQELMDQKRTEVGHHVTAKRARARRHLTELETRLGPDVFDEATHRLEDEAPETLDSIHLGPGEWAIDRDCPECGSRGRSFGPIDLEPMGYDGDEPSQFSLEWEIAFTPKGFACNVCRLSLSGAQELQECSLPAFRHEVDIEKFGDNFDPEVVADQLYGIDD
ncbi:hypothetical protein P3H15_36200 [Rhodococcus sp. T2V]|uniref:hypothetical protein n=1 Tax=Rhodococcus sp. T2V TaxID=3034164 RepID=UPI0023E0A28C|nr:hypothetical protein [Rhodococcus sp. T2V]MDF3310462.1 hypothetical protein [Rhodococcus sp. T2V]